MNDLFGALSEQPQRLFFALWPPAALAHELHALARSLQGRVMNEAGLHVTVAFAGEQLRARIPALCQLAERHPLPRVALDIDRLEYWAGQFVVAVPQTVPPALHEAVMRLHAEMRALGMRVEPHGWRPHITLLRKAPSQDLPTLEPHTWTPEALYLAVSDGSGHYELLQRWATVAPG